MSALRRPERLLSLWLGGAAVVLVVVSGIVPNQHWLPELANADSQVRIMFDVTAEMNVWAWFNVLVLAAASAAHALVGQLRRSAGEPAWPWFVVAAALAALSLDDLAALHERLDPIGRRLGAGEGLTRAAWVVPGLLVAAVVVWTAWTLARRLSGASRLLLVAGFTTFLGAAFVLEAAGFALLDLWGGNGGPLYAGLAHLEELLEAWGAVLILASAVAGLTLDPAPGRLSLRLRDREPARRERSPHRRR